ncbi:uncharacterized protein LOC131210954 [Anopheles bellator]|uniref:uncharacterized protein LOC131210954 n=1 Tax=Anopheles bellator TaxID=139047 RepID=UPI00264A08AD|nr:uncharacterized protein LOC131210954 [Anopheles bellator]
MARSVILTVAALSALSYVVAMNCPYCLNVVSCASQSVPKVDCSGTIVSETVSEISRFFRDIKAYNVPATEYSCVDVRFRPLESLSDTFTVKGCTAGRKSVCGEPTVEFNGNFSCYSHSGAGAPRLTGLLMGVLFIIGALVFVN